jgi:HlyD family secretion protein
LVVIASPEQESDNWRLGWAAKEANLRNAMAGVDVAQANIKAQQAAVHRLEQLTSYERVVAPFDGIVTSPNVDVGNLVSADQAGSGQRRMFTIAHITGRACGSTSGRATLSG